MFLEYLGYECPKIPSEMHRNEKQQYYNYSLLKKAYVNLENILISQRYNHDHSRSSSFYTYHRMGHDGQNKIFSFEHVVVFFSKMLSLPTDSYQDSTANPKKKSYVYRYKYIIYANSQI